MGISLNLSGKSDTPNERLLLDAYQNPASPEMIEKLFDYGRYLLISSSRAGGYPAGRKGNMQESMMAFYDCFDAHMDEFRRSCRRLPGSCAKSRRMWFTGPTLPAAYGFQYDLKLTDTTKNRSKPVIDEVSMTFN